MPSTLAALLSWANTQYRLETPELQHSVGLTDEGGSPEMKPAAASYLGLLVRKALSDAKDEQPDDWRRQACRVDEDGKYRTPLRCALERVPDPEMRHFLRDLVPEQFRPEDVGVVHGLPKWTIPIVMYRALSVLRQKYREQPETRWISGRSDAQRAAETTTEEAA
jgi:hypothetical protein